MRSGYAFQFACKLLAIYYLVRIYVFIVCRMLEAENFNASLGILVLQVHTQYWHSCTVGVTISHIANSVALCLLQHRMDDRGM